LCPSMKKAEKVKDKNGKELRIRGSMSCKTFGLIYGMWCEGCKRNVEKAMNQLRQRFYGHRSDMKGQDEDKPMQNFKEDKHG
jgi:hypothetical protein